MALYKLFVPAQATGASTVHFDLFKLVGDNKQLRVLSVLPVVSGAVAVTGVVGVDLFLTRTTAVGTGGTAATAEGTSLTAATFSAVDSNQPIALQYISARLTPTGGATAGAVIATRSLYTEETNAGTYTPPVDFIRQNGPGLYVPAGTGIRVVQSSVASVGNIAFDVTLDLS
jgi:hypothetical protein